MQTLLNRPGFHEKFDHWKSTQSGNDGLYKDLYDGKVWHEFQHYDEGQPFLSQSFTNGLMLNIDWFRPCKHTEYSIVIYYYCL